MQPAKIVLLLVVGLCATQSLNANPLSDLEDAIKEIISKGDKLANDFEKKVWGLIGDLKGDLSNIPKCMESEKPKLTALMHEAEEGAMQCITKAMSDVQPASKKMAAVLKDLIPLVKTVVPALLNCKAQHQDPITFSLCMIRVITPVADEMKHTMSDIKDMLPEMKKLVEDMKPWFQECATKAEGQVNQVKAMMAELEKCVANGQ